MATINLAAATTAEPALLLARDGEQRERVTGEGEQAVAFAWFLAAQLSVHSAPTSLPKG